MNERKLIIGLMVTSIFATILMLGLFVLMMYEPSIESHRTIYYPISSSAIILSDDSAKPLHYSSLVKQVSSKQEEALSSVSNEDNTEDDEDHSYHSDNSDDSSNDDNNEDTNQNSNTNQDDAAAQPDNTNQDTNTAPVDIPNNQPIEGGFVEDIF